MLLSSECFASLAVLDVWPGERKALVGTHRHFANQVCYLTHEGFLGAPTYALFGLVNHDNLIGGWLHRFWGLPFRFSGQQV